MAALFICDCKYNSYCKIREGNISRKKCSGKGSETPPTKSEDDVMSEIEDEGEYPAGHVRANNKMRYKFTLAQR
jgi:hypothetical protein